MPEGKSLTATSTKCHPSLARRDVYKYVDYLERVCINCVLIELDEVDRQSGRICAGLCHFRFLSRLSLLEDLKRWFTAFLSSGRPVDYDERREKEEVLAFLLGFESCRCAIPLLVAFWGRFWMGLIGESRKEIFRLGGWVGDLVLEAAFTGGMSQLDSLILLRSRISISILIILFLSFLFCLVLED